MSLALPGFVDTGIATSFTNSASVLVKMRDLHITTATLNEWTIRTQWYEDPNPGGEVVVKDGLPYDFALTLQTIIGGPVAEEVVYEFIEIGAFSEFTEAYEDEFRELILSSDSYEFAETSGPYRLGVRHKAIDGIGSQNPVFAIHSELEYAWFADENTTIETACGDLSAPTRYYTSGGWSQTPEPGLTPVQVTPAGVSFSCDCADIGEVEVEFRSISPGGYSANTSTLTGPPMTGLGGGDVDCERSGAQSEVAHIPHVADYDLDLPLFGTATSSNVAIESSFNGTLATPYVATRVYTSSSWAGGGYVDEYLSIASGADTGLYPSDDRAICVWGAPARQAPDVAPQSYTPTSISLATSLDVHRPDTETPSEFVASSGAIVVTENATTTVMVVGSTGAHVRREFGATGTDLPEWRPWLGVGAAGHSDAAFNPDLSHTTKHSSGADIFDWSSFRYIRVSLAAPVTGTLTLTVEGVHLDISDPHTTGSDRYDGFSVTETPYTKTYTLTIAHAGSGALDYDLDLCFPVEGGPFYHGRIEAIKLSGFGVGTYTLAGIKLVSLATRGSATLGGTVELKTAPGAPVSRGDYSALHASHNGANPTLNLGDLANKGEEIGAHGGALRHTDPLTGAVSGLTLDTMRSLEVYLTQLHALEGWTVTWSSAVADAANEDGYGASLGAGTADWARPGTFSFTAGASYQPACQPIVRRIRTPAGYPIAIYTRQPVYGAVEAIATQGSAPAPSGSSATYGGVTATCDSHGWVWFPGVPTGTALTGHSGVLTPRDRVRVLVSVPVEPGVGLANLSVPLMNWYLEAWIENGNVQVGFAPWVMPPFQHTTQASNGGTASYPELYQRRSRIYVLWQEGASSPVIYRAHSDDWARSWSVPEVAFVSGKYPCAATCPQTLTTVEFAYLGGAILAQRLTPSLATPGPVFYPAGIGTLADEPFDAVWVGDGRRTLLLRASDGVAIQRYVSYDQGTSFKLVV